MEKKNVNTTGAVINCEVCNVFVNPGSALISGSKDGSKVVIGHAVSDKAQAAKIIEKALRDKPEMQQYLDIVIGKIQVGGYMNVEGIVRRWIPSQCLDMFYDPSGFHKRLKARGYDYTWKVLIRDLKVQAKLVRENDLEGYEDRNRWYNVNVAVDMVNDFLNDMKKHVTSLKIHMCRGRQYIDLRVRGLNNQRGVFVDELNEFIGSYVIAGHKIANSKTPDELYKNVKVFFSMIKRFSNWSPSAQSKSFVNAYKAAGAYYTIKDLILFEGCHFKKTHDHVTGLGMPLSTEASLDYLDTYISELVKRGINHFGYEALGLLKAFLEVNQFDYDAARESWAKQTEARKAGKK